MKKGDASAARFVVGSAGNGIFLPRDAEYEAHVPKTMRFFSACPPPKKKTLRFSLRCFGDFAAKFAANLAILHFAVWNRSDLFAIACNGLRNIFLWFGAFGMKTLDSLSLSNLSHFGGETWGMTSSDSCYVPMPPCISANVVRLGFLCGLEPPLRPFSLRFFGTLRYAIGLIIIITRHQTLLFWFDNVWRNVNFLHQ